MQDHVYKTTEIVGTSGKGIEDAVQNAVSRAAKTVRNMRWVEIKEMRGHIEGSAVSQWQVIMKISFTLDG